MFDAIISEMLRFIREMNEDLETSEVRNIIALTLSSELMVNSGMSLHEFCEHVSRRILLKLSEWMEAEMTKKQEEVMKSE